ncbi:uncharacterized protein [Chironomus tepperi]|uniref:uncharacterized protein n=1 Tax=Chironomus tepperi TaxID=113505 RepID=UPI00391FC4D5
MNTKLFVYLINLFVLVNSQDQCGISGIDSAGPTGLIYNGESAKDTQWPWAVALYLNDGKYRNYFCSGTLISDQFILTAAHCIHNKGNSRYDADRITVTLGTADSSENKGVIRKVVETKMHPDWNDIVGTPYDADLAIIKLDRPVKFSNKIRPACLPKSHEKVFEIEGYVAGFGVSNDDVLDGKLRFLKIPTVTQENCLWHPSGFSTTASKRTFCGGDLTKSACRGDSGAGFVVKSFKSTFEVIGIVSAAILARDENCRANSYTVFTSVPLFVDWILREIGRDKEISNEVWNSYNPSTTYIPPNSVYLDEGTVRTYVARRKMNGNLIIGKFIPAYNSIFLPYFRAELQFWDDIEILSTNKKYQWIPFTGTFPSNAVQGGYEGTIKLFVGRKMIDGNYIIGKVVDSSKKIFVPYFAREHEFQDDFDILVLSDDGWTSYNATTDNIPTDAISVQEGDVKTYVARRRLGNNLIVGKYIPMWSLVYVTYNGMEQRFDDGIELMTTNKNHKWIPFTGTFPSNAVQGGHEGRSKLYVGRVKHQGKFIIGKVTDSSRTISVGYFDKEFKYQSSFEILVLEN